LLANASMKHITEPSEVSTPMRATLSFGEMLLQSQ